MSIATHRSIADLEAAGAITAIQDGNHGGDHPKASEYVENGIPFVMASDVRDGFVNLGGTKRLPKDRTDRLRIGFAIPGDVLLTHKGTVGEVAIVPEVADYVMLTPQVTYYRVNEQKLSARYLAFAFRSPDFQAQLASISAQSTRPYVAISTQRHLRIQWCELPAQHRIASILGAYDDLIEVNRRRIAVLEEMARRLFEEWFVHLRFPGSQHEADLTDTLVPLPSGWMELPLAEVCDRITDGAHHSPPGVAAGRMMASVKDMRDWGFDLTGCRQISDADFAELVRMGCQPEPGDILIAKDGANLNKHTFLVTDQLPIVLLSSIAILRPKAGMEREFLVALLKSENTSSAIKSMKSGAAIPRIVLKDFKRLPILLPAKDVRRRFEAMVTPMHSMCRILGHTNANLAASRDLLLPRLISGELSVTAAERELENAA